MTFGSRDVMGNAAGMVAILESRIDGKFTIEAVNPALEQHWQFPLVEPSSLTLEQTREVVDKLDAFELELLSGEGIGKFFACTRICRNYTGSRIDYTTRLPAALDAATA